jgi:hypothetical protein
MPITPIKRLYRAVVWVDCPFDSSNPRTFSQNCDAATDRMEALETEAEKLADQFDVQFESLNTQALWQAALALESEDEAKLLKAVEAIEALIARTEGANVQES